MRLLERGINVEDTVYRSKAVGEPPLMLGISVFHALKDAVASTVDYAVSPRLDAPATAERILHAVVEARERAATQTKAAVVGALV